MSFMPNIARSRGSEDACSLAGVDAAINPSSSSVSPRVREARKDLLDGIVEFAMKHDLGITGPNLAAICDGLSGANTDLAEAFVAREISGEPINQRWLESVVRIDADEKDRAAELNKLMNEIEQTLVRFGHTVQTAADETNDQRGVLNEQINQMGQTRGSGDDVARVIGLSRTMLASIERVESAMVASQAESDTLRANLAKARLEADIDHLTRLPNRRAFERELMARTEQAAASDAPLCVAICDVDHFKAVNDTHGHEAGDRILCAVANLLNSVASESCFVGRHGGEEFVLLFYGVDMEDAFEKFDGVRRAMAYKQLMNRETGKPFGKVTFSGGLARVTDFEDPHAAVGKADEALYQAKQTGRNRIEMAGFDGSSVSRT